MVEEENVVNDEMSFAELFEKTEVKRDYLQPGQKVEATIVKISPEWVFLDLGGKSEGYLDRKELTDADGNLTVKEGEVLSAYFLSSRANEKLFTTRIGVGNSARDHIEEIWKSGIPVEGVVEKEIKGGFEIRLPGDMRGFCPFSQMGLQRVEKDHSFVGQRMSFRVTEFGEKGRNIILSNRVLMEEQRRKDEEALRATLQEGMMVTGSVVSVRDFGAFLDMGGIQGLLPISEIGWDRVEDIQERLSVGEVLEVVITKLDWENNRISLSLKQTLSDPWEEVATRFREGAVHTGTVVRLTTFGAFVKLAPGIDGLIHISKLGRGRRIAHPRDAVTVGETLEVKIDAVDLDKKRISLSIPLAEAPEKQIVKVSGEPEDDYRRYLGKTSTGLGSLGDLMQKTMDRKKRS